MYLQEKGFIKHVTGDWIFRDKYLFFCFLTSSTTTPAKVAIKETTMDSEDETDKSLAPKGIAWMHSLAPT